MLVRYEQAPGNGSGVCHLAGALSLLSLMLCFCGPSGACAQTPAIAVSTSDEGTSTRRFEEPVHTDVRPSSFQEITPGETTRAELLRQIGHPKEIQQQDGEEVLIFALGPFPRVEMIVVDEVVDSVVVHLAAPSAPRSVAQELGLVGFAPATILSENGEPLGHVYPERGVAFSFEPGSNPPVVTQLVLEPVSPEFFLLRSQDESSKAYERIVADLNYVLEADPSNSKARWTKARVYTAARHYERALAEIEQALDLDKQEPQYRLLRARLRNELGQYQPALRETEFVLAQKTSDLVRGRAEMLTGDLLSVGPKRDYHAAMQHHLAAIELLAPFATSPRQAERREARELLFAVHLSIANDITRGEWTGKKESAPKWLQTARELADEVIAEDGGDESMRLVLFRHALASYVGMKGLVDPTDVAEEALRLGKRLISESTDELRKRELQWLLVQALGEAVRIEQMRGKAERAVEYTRQADALLKSLTRTEESRRRINEVRGRMYFLVGSTYAIENSDHSKAVAWYGRAMPYLEQSEPQADSVDLVRHGQRFVSMGVSFWEVNSRSDAVRLTERGMRMMDAAIEGGNLDRSPLVVPYGNLASMYQHVGREEEAKQLAVKAAELAGIPGREETQLR